MTTIDYVSIAIGVISLLLAVYLYITVRRQKNRLDKFFTKNNNLDLEIMFKDLFSNIHDQEIKIHDILKKLEEMNNKSSKYYYRLALERFNPFDETGGDQSFVLVLLNDYNSGLIVSSLHSRENTRVYAKEIENGKSSRKLSTEEESLLNKVMKEK